LNLIGLIIISLASKYQERIALKLSNISKLAGVICPNNPEQIRELEFEVMKALQFKIGG